MNILEAFRLALTGLLSNRLRSILTMLGIIIGVSAVIALVSFGQGIQNYIVNTFQSLGSNLMFVLPMTPSGPNAKTIKAKPLTMDDAKAIANPLEVSGVAAVAPIYSIYATVVVNKNSMVLQVGGSTPEWQVAREWYPSQGRFIEDGDVSTSAHVVVLGSSAVKKLFDPGDEPVGQDVRINNIPFRVIGVLETKGGGGGLADPDQIAIVPITTALTRLGDARARTSSGAYAVSAIVVKTISDKDTTPTKKAIERLLLDRHNVEYRGDEDFQVITSDQILSIFGNITGLLTAFLSLIAGISLIVGGIGVMNIMLVSVTERTREIGLRKAVGARYLDLMLQFLIESVMLSVIGGMIGILLGALVAFVATRAIPSLSLSLTLPAVLLATGVSTAIGIFFGIYPASRAASMNPIEALRYE
jgi:putative ABC transport system permease protein